MSNVAEEKSAAGSVLVSCSNLFSSMEASRDVFSCLQALTLNAVAKHVLLASRPAQAASGWRSL